MSSRPNLPTARDKLLFTPGPLTTSLSVKQAMLHDAGSWHFEFNAKVKWIREKLLEIAGLSPEAGWETILLQGSGTFGVEAVFATCVPSDGKVAVLANGAYGERMVIMLQRLKIDHVVFRTPENIPNDHQALDQALAADKTVTHVAQVHCETTTGILNPLNETGAVVKRHGRGFIVDAMSSFGAISIDWAAAGMDYLVSSANKCIEGVPGFSFVICRREALLACEGYARSLSLDLLDQFSQLAEILSAQRSRHGSFLADHRGRYPPFGSVRSSSHHSSARRERCSVVCSESLFHNCHATHRGRLLNRKR